MIINLNRLIPGAPHFSWYELTRTEHRGYLDDNQQVPVDLQEAGEALALMLEKIRAFWERPLIVHSAYRCPALNQAIGGSKTSQHMKFEAADFHVQGLDLGIVFQRLRSSNLPFGQLILEGADPFAGLSSWVHVSLGPPRRIVELSHQVLYFSTRTGKYTQLNSPFPQDPAA